MAAVNYTIRLDETDKKLAEQVFKELGLTLAAGLNVYIKAVARKRRIPFELALNDVERIVTASPTKPTLDEKNMSLQSLSGLLSGYKVDLDVERVERILKNENID